MNNSNAAIDNSQFLDYIRSKCEDDFEFFVKYFFKHQSGARFKFSNHHHRICEKLMAVYRGDITFLMINLPPRYSKTELVVKMFSAWCFVKNDKSEFIHLSYSDHLAMDNSSAIKNIVKSVEFKQLWPHITITPHKDSKKAWQTAANGSFYSTAAGGSVTGFGAGKIDEIDENGDFVFSGAIIIDDPLKPDDAYSEPKRLAVNRRWDETIKSRRNGKLTPVIVVMQRLHEDDFCGMLHEDSEFDWDTLVLEALTEDEHGILVALWPEKHTVEQLETMQAKNPYMFSGQMQQNPSPVGGGIFKDEYWKYYDVLPPDISVVRVYADTAQKTKEHNDYSVFQCWGKSASMGIFLMDQLRGKWEAPELESNFISFWNKHKPALRKPMGAQVAKIEDKSSGSSLIQTIARKSLMPIEAIQRGTDKFSRAMGVVSYISSGHVHLPANESWLNDYKDEFRKFTPLMTHKNDDQIDPTLDAIEDLLVNDAFSYSEAM